MRLKLQTQSLTQTKPIEYLERFVFGGVVTVLAGLVSAKWGPVIGGLFLAFPGILPCGISLVEKHKAQREADQKKSGIVSARGEASVEAAGASAGTIGLAAFALVLWQMLGGHGLVVTLACATGAWLAVSIFCWWVRDRI